MKFTWGTGIAIVLAVFILAMAFAVYKVLQQEYQLVTRDYYEQELVFQDKIDQKRNALKLGEPAQIAFSEKGAFLKFPKTLEGKTGHLSVEMYCVTDEKRDFIIRRDTDWVIGDIPLDPLRVGGGRWIAKISLHHKGTDYYFEPEIYLP